MFTYTTARNHFGALVKDSVAGTLTLADTLIDTQIKRLIGKRNWSFLEKTFAITLSASTQFKPLPISVKKVKACFVTVGSYKHPVVECESREMWDALNQSTITSDIPEYFFIFNGTIGLYPIPASNGNVLTITALRKHKTLSIADYTTGGILTATLGSAAVVGTSSVWSTSMTGRVLSITESDIDLKGDGYWYDIASVESVTTLTLTQLYAGTSIAAGNAAYTIGQTSIIPEEYQDVPILAAIYMYYKTIKPETDLAKEFKDEFNDRYAEMVIDYGQKSTSPVIDDGYPNQVNNPNSFVSL